MIGYYLRPAGNNKIGHQEAGKYLLKVVKNLKENPNLIKEEVLSFNPELAKEEDLDEYANYYNDPEDGALEITKDKEDDMPCVAQLASGGGKERNIKEAFRRAFCRLVIKEMHKKKMEVTLSIV